MALTHRMALTSLLFTAHLSHAALILPGNDDTTVTATAIFPTLASDDSLVTSVAYTKTTSDRTTVTTENHLTTSDGSTVTTGDHKSTNDVGAVTTEGQKTSRNETTVTAEDQHTKTDLLSIEMSVLQIPRSLNKETSNGTTFTANKGRVPYVGYRTKRSGAKQHHRIPYAGYKYDESLNSEGNSDEGIREAYRKSYSENDTPEGSDELLGISNSDDNTNEGTNELNDINNIDYSYEEVNELYDTNSIDDNAYENVQELYDMESVDSAENIRCEDYDLLKPDDSGGKNELRPLPAAAGTPILNVRMAFRHPLVWPRSHESGPPNISLSTGEALDWRPVECQDRPEQQTLLRHNGPSPWEVEECGGEFTDVGGVISSPGYPFKYPNNARCSYSIQVEEGQHIGLVCDDFALQPGERDCENDVLVLYSGRANTSDTDAVRYCGSETVDQVLPSSSLRLVFTSDSQYQYRGFLCRYSALNMDGTSVAGISLSNVTAEEHGHTILCSGPGDSGWAGRCGINMHDKQEMRIVGGDAVRKYEFPWMVAVLKRCGHDDVHYCHLCGGTVIHYRWILTGAHCIIRENVEKLGLLLGDHNLYTLTPSQKFFQVQSTFIHPRFNFPSPLNNDVALMKLPQVMTFSRYISPICLPPRDVHEFVASLPDVAEVEPPTTTELPYYSTSVPLTYPLLHDMLYYRNVSVFGWGVTDDAGTLGTKLRGVSVQVLSNQLCDWFYGLMTSTMFCSSGTGGHGPCQGDSGSPAQMQMKDGRWVQVGVLSFGAAFGCETGYPSGNVLLPLYVDWIHFVTGLDFTEFA